MYWSESTVEMYLRKKVNDKPVTQLLSNTVLEKYYLSKSIMNKDKTVYLNTVTKYSDCVTTCHWSGLGYLHWQHHSEAGIKNNLGASHDQITDITTVVTVGKSFVVISCALPQQYHDVKKVWHLMFWRKFEMVKKETEKRQIQSKMWQKY
jgi:hypothetical protein